jgi:hypothetical protein
MSTEEKILKLVQRLHAKTGAGEIAWEKTAGKDVYLTAFPNYTVKVYTVSDIDSDDQVYFVSIVNETGTVIERASDVDVKKAFPQAKATQLIREIYTMARRQALGVDSALDSLLVELGG